MMTEKQTRPQSADVSDLPEEELEEISGGPTPIYMSINDTGLGRRQITSANKVKLTK